MRLIDEIYFREYNVTDTDSLRIFLLQLVKISVVDVTDAELDDNPAVPPEKYLEIMNRIQINFVPQILTSLSIPIRVQKTIVEMGICYSINSKIAMYNSPEYVWSVNVKYTNMNYYQVSEFSGIGSEISTKSKNYPTMTLINWMVNFLFSFQTFQKLIR